MRVQCFSKDELGNLYSLKCSRLGCIEGDDTIRKSNIDMGYDIDALVGDEASTG